MEQLASQAEDGARLQEKARALAAQAAQAEAAQAKARELEARFSSLVIPSAHAGVPELRVLLPTSRV